MEQELWNRGNRDEIILYYLPYVKKLACSFSRKNPQIEYDDMVSEGTLGLMQAIDNFDISRASFQTFSRRRIVGHMIDFLRRGDLIPRSQRRKGSTRRVYHMSTVMFEDEDYFDKIVYNHDFESVDTKDMMEHIQLCMNRKEKLIMNLRLEGFMMKEIGKVIGCSESRVSQIISGIENGRSAGSSRIRRSVNRYFKKAS